MSAPIVKLYATTASRLKDLQVVDGQLIFVKDTRKVCLDLDGIRVEYTVLSVIPTEQNRIDSLAPAEGFYYVEETNTLWRYHGAWIQITPSGLGQITFGHIDSYPSVGNPNQLYVDDSITYRWDLATSSYLPAANATVWETLDN